MVKLTNLIAQPFYKIYNDIQKKKHTHYWLYGGRGSTKSSFISLMIILGIMQSSNTNAVVVRKIGLYIKDSVYEQLLWAIEQLGVSNLWQAKLSPMELIYIPTGQKILFRGADKPKKLKSTKVHTGYIRYIWYEECDEFQGMEEIRTINQSLMRGGEVFTVFYSYNPPQSQRSWVNKESLEHRDDRLVHKSSYLEVPKKWLGEQFIIEAEHLKNTNLRAYEHEYLGEVTGTGGEVFTNLSIESISDEIIKVFDNIHRGIDFGYAIDPFVYVVCHYDKKRKRLYIFDEIYKVGLSNRNAYELINNKVSYNNYIVCDSAEPKSLGELREYGLRVIGAKKGADSIEYGIKSLQSLEQIIIDSRRCPHTSEEFYNYELERDNNGEFKANYPDKNNHTIDAIRYALEKEFTNRKARVIKRSDLGI